MTVDAEQFELIVLDHTGDTRLMWDKDSKDEVKAAKELFDKMKAKGYLAYNVQKNGDPGEVIQEFDKKMGKIIMTPQLVGG
jgi:phosphoribosylaminoimidazole-succinocarboxamide synthase